MKISPSLPSSIKVGILGLGTVGSAVGAALQANAAMIRSRTGLQIRVIKACDLRKVKAGFPVTADPYAVINDPEISVIVETIGGVGPAKKLVLAAIKAGKQVVTSNKELIALHMEEILSAARKKGVTVLFEAAVGGGIPILNTLRDNLAANEIKEVFGIVNGTTNYILSKMTENGMDFSQALKKAQAKGFAEANPKMDIEGYDAAYKAVILSSVAFGVKVKWREVYREGIENISLEDIRYALEIGYVIKLLAIARMTQGEIEVRVHPALVPKSHPLAKVSENFNAIYVKGFPVGELMFYGPGAGGNPTASAVINDILSLARPRNGARGDGLKPMRVKKIEEINSRYYLRLQVPDHPGVLAGISKAFADKQVSIDAVTQKETVGRMATIVILLHQVSEKNLRAALQLVQKKRVVSKISSVIRIL